MENPIQGLHRNIHQQFIDTRQISCGPPGNPQIVIDDADARLLQTAIIGDILSAIYDMLYVIELRVTALSMELTLGRQ